jgi:4-hydroxybenzoate polyprenyltransferase
VKQSLAGRLFELSRPFTLVAPALGFASAAVTAAGAVPRTAWSVTLLIYPAVGSAMAAVLNAASNALNQICDLDIDRINKPRRPLPSGRLSIAAAGVFAGVAYAAALGLAWLVAPEGRHECFWIVLAATACTIGYSVPPVRTKRRGLLANVTIAAPRGVLLKVAGWASVKPALGLEPWFIGAVFGLFLLGATTTKDFADVEGDARGGCRTLPVRYGPQRAAWMIAPSFVVPFLLIGLGALAGILTGNRTLLLCLCAVLTIYGVFVSWLMLRRPGELAAGANHASWTHMYRMMFLAQAGFAVAYLF